MFFSRFYRLVNGHTEARYVALTAMLSLIAEFE
jgi:hypothetical protein